MEKRLKERLTGAVILVLLAVIFIPMILDDSLQIDSSINQSNVPLQPTQGQDTRIVPLRDDEISPPDINEIPLQKTESTPVEAQSIKEESVSDITELQETPKSQVVDTTPKATATNITQQDAGIPAWVVQVGSFSSETNAKALGEKLRKNGYAAFVEPLKRKTGIIYRVRVGPELLRSDAQAIKDKLKKSMKLEGIVLQYP